MLGRHSKTLAMKVVDQLPQLLLRLFDRVPRISGKTCKDSYGPWVSKTRVCSQVMVMFHLGKYHEVSLFDVSKSGFWACLLIVSGGEMWNLTDKLQQWSCSEMSKCRETAETQPL